jgi:hypothetical protein
VIKPIVRKQLLLFLSCLLLKFDQHIISQLKEQVLDYHFQSLARLVEEAHLLCLCINTCLLKLIDAGQVNDNGYLVLAVKEVGGGLISVSELRLCLQKL